MKKALILGASGSIGESIAYELAKEGYSLYCHYYQNEKKVSDFVKKMRVKYPQQDFFMVCLDMLETKEIDTFLAQLFQVDVVVFASGFSTYKLVSELTEQEIDALWQIHVKTPILICQKLQEKLSKGNGKVLFVSSIYAKMGSSMESVYSAVKSAQLGFVKSYAKEVATLNICVNAILPGAVESQMNAFLTQEEREELIEKIPLRRFATPNEIASVASFLVSEKASYMTGSLVDVNGGWF